MLTLWTYRPSGSLELAKEVGRRTGLETEGEEHGKRGRKYPLVADWSYRDALTRLEEKGLVTGFGLTQRGKETIAEACLNFFEALERGEVKIHEDDLRLLVILASGAEKMLIKLKLPGRSLVVPNDITRLVQRSDLEEPKRPKDPVQLRICHDVIRVGLTIAHLSRVSGSRSGFHDYLVTNGWAGLFSSLESFGFFDRAANRIPNYRDILVMRRWLGSNLQNKAEGRGRNSSPN